jgi:transposase
LLRSLLAYLRGEPKVWNVAQCPALPKNMRGDCTASGTVWSRNAFNTSTVSRGFARCKAFTVTIRCARRRWGGWSNCARPRAARYRRGQKSEIKRELRRLELVVEMIATLEAERNAIVEDQASTHVNAKKI